MQPRDLFAEKGININQPRDLFAEKNINPSSKKSNEKNNLMQQEKQEQQVQAFDPANQTATGSFVPAGTYNTSAARNIANLETAAFFPEYQLAKNALRFSPIAKSGINYLSSILQNYGINAGLSALNPNNKAEDIKRSGETGAITTAGMKPLLSLLANSNPILRSLAGGAGGAALGTYAGSQYGSPYLGGETGGTLGAILPLLLGSKSRAASNIFGHLNQDEALKAKSGAERFGISDYTPGSATNNPIVNAAQQDVGTSNIGANILNESSQRFNKQSNNALNSMLENISPRDIQKNLESPLYKISSNDVIPINNLNALMSNPTIKKSFNAVTKDPELAYELKDYPINSIAHLDAAKKYIDGKIASTNDTNEIRILTNAKKELLNETDKVSPTYKDARQVSGRRQTRESLEEAISNNNLSKILNDDKEYNKLYQNLSDREGVNPVSYAQDRLNSFRDAFRNIKDPLTQKAIARLSAHDNDIARPMEFAAQQIKRLTNGSYDRAAARLITDPKWEKELDKIIKIKNDPTRRASIINLITRISAMSANKQEGRE